MKIDGRKRRFRLFSLWLAMAGLLAAMPMAMGETTPAGEEQLAQSNFQDLLAVMEETTTIATKTRLNADFVPGMVTVLKGEEMRSRGIHTLQEALKLIPGIAETRNNIAIMVRGVGNWATGKLKILLNDVPCNETLSALAPPLYLLPMEMIERIEVIRGPGSAVYGEYAFSGVINVITHDRGARIFGQYGSFDTYAGGGRHALEDGDWRASINLAGWNSMGSNSRVEQDSLAGLSALGMDTLSLAPGFSNERVRSRNAILTLDYKKTSLVVQYVEGDNGDGVGFSNMLPSQDRRLVLQEHSTMVELRQGFDLLPRLPVTVKAGTMDYGFLLDHTYFAPPGVNPLREDPAADGSMIGSAQAREYKTYAGLMADWKGWDDHLLTLGVDWATIGLRDVWTRGNMNPATGGATVTLRPWDNRYDWVLQEPGHRRIQGFMLQDQWDMTADLTATLGLRHDQYSDVGNSLTPRLALVYRLTDAHILKAQYGTAFRPPAFAEMYSNNIVIESNPDIKPETIRTFDLGYIHRFDDGVARMTLFHSSLQDMIDLAPDVDGIQHYANMADVDLSGVEWELEKKLASNLKLDANLSFVRTRDHTTRHELPGAANWLANLGLIYRPLPDYSLAVQTRHVGSRNRAVDDPRDKLGGNTTVDVTGTLFNLMVPGLTFQLGAKNLLDTHAREPATAMIREYQAMGIPPYPAYPGDFQSSGLGLWAKLAYDF